MRNYVKRRKLRRNKGEENKRMDFKRRQDFKNDSSMSGSKRTQNRRRKEDY